MKENRIKKTSNYVPYNRSHMDSKPHGKPVGVISVQNNFIYLTVSPYRRDFNKIVDQLWQQTHAKLPEYEQSLFNSCFKNW